jgi:hypothetical protein
MGLNNDNFMLFCITHYDNVQCHSFDEFKKDLTLFVMLKKLLFRFVYKDDDCIRLIVNNITTLYNLFGDATQELLLFKLDKKYHSIVFTVLAYLGKVNYNESNMDKLTVEKLKGLL